MSVHYIVHMSSIERVIQVRLNKYSLTLLKNEVINLFQRLSFFRHGHAFKHSIVLSFKNSILSGRSRAWLARGGHVSLATKWMKRAWGAQNGVALILSEVAN